MVLFSLSSTLKFHLLYCQAQCVEKIRGLALLRGFSDSWVAFVLLDVKCLPESTGAHPPSALACSAHQGVALPSLLKCVLCSDSSRDL
jgi:hypothetical protein